MSGALAQVVVLPTRKVIDAAWMRHVAYQRSLAADPSQHADPEFAAAAADAERIYVEAYVRWVGR